jgi:hypothetical protein
MEEFLYRVGPFSTLLAQHNWPLLIYVPLILWVASRAFLRPERRVLLLLYGLLILAVAFEYEKHGTRLVAGTVRYLFEESPLVRRVSEFVLVDLAPIAAHALGLSMVVVAVALGLRGLRPEPRKSRSGKETENGQQESIAPLTSG